MVVGEITKAKSEDEKVCGVDGLGAGDVFLGIGIDESTFFVLGEQNGGFEAVMFGKNLGQHGAGFLGAILVVARNEDDVFSVAWFPFGPGEA